jgi:hypothetical protein
VKHRQGAAWRPCAFLIEIKDFLAPVFGPRESQQRLAAQARSTTHRLKRAENEVKMG